MQKSVEASVGDPGRGRWGNGASEAPRGTLYRSDARTPGRSRLPTAHLIVHEPLRGGMTSLIYREENVERFLVPLSNE